MELDGLNLENLDALSEDQKLALFKFLAKGNPSLVKTASEDEDVKRALKQGVGGTPGRPRKESAFDSIAENVWNALAGVFDCDASAAAVAAAIDARIVGVERLTDAIQASFKSEDGIEHFVTLRFTSESASAASKRSGALEKIEKAADLQALEKLCEASVKSIKNAEIDESVRTSYLDDVLNAVKDRKIALTGNGAAHSASAPPPPPPAA